MDIEVTLYPPLRENRFSKAIVTLTGPATVDSLLQYLSIKQHEVEGLYVNGRVGTFTQPIVSGDRITLLSMMGGG